MIERAIEEEGERDEKEWANVYVNGNDRDFRRIPTMSANMYFMHTHTYTHFISRHLNLLLTSPIRGNAIISLSCGLWMK